MPRISGIDIPNNKRITISLRYLYGIGATTAKQILNEAGIDENMRADKLSEGEIAKIRELIESRFKVEGDLRREVSGNIKLLKDIGAYRGLRHIKRLPCRGQRSKTNARTAKGRARIAIAGKRQAPTSK